MTTAKDAQRFNRDMQQVATQEVAMDSAIKTALLNLHTSMPGIIVSFNPATQTATVQPAISRIFTELGPVAIPVCQDVPVQFPSGGNFVLTFPVDQGDECILMFSERAIDFWYANGGVQLPSEYRTHDYSDAMAVVGLRSQPRKLENLQTDGAELRTVNRSTYIKLTDGTIFIKGNIVHEGDNTQTGNMSRTGTSTTSGLITGAGGMTVAGGTGVNMTGSINHSGGTITSNGKNIGSTHVHPETGSITEGPQ